MVPRRGPNSLPHQIRHLLSGPCRALECQPQRFRAFVRAVVKPAQRVTSSFGGGCSATKKRECPFALRATHLAFNSHGAALRVNSHPARTSVTMPRPPSGGTRG